MEQGTPGGIPQGPQGHPPDPRGADIFLHLILYSFIFWIFSFFHVRSKENNKE